MTNANDFAAMGKTELRAACKEHGVKNYGKLTNDGMRAALVAATAPKADAPITNGWARLAVGAKAAPAPKPANVTKVVDGKRVDPNAPKPKAERAPRADKPAAPVVPRVSRKGYTIQKEREERNGVKRPSEGTVCGNVWAEFDKNPEIKAGELATIADANGWNRTNVSCEFYAWRKFMGIKGRASK